MSEPVIEVRGLVRRFGKAEAVQGLDLTVEAGRCFGFFGRNGAGKTTTIKCLLNLLHRDAGAVRVFGADPAKDEVAVKRRLAYVPDTVAFYPWMSVRDTLDYLASFRSRWNDRVEKELLERFELDRRQKAMTLSRGQRTQLALVGAIAAEPDLLVLDEPTSGLDPIVRRDFIETIIGAFQGGGDGPRTVFVSTHLIAEFEGLIEELAIIDQGRGLLQLGAEEARDRFRKLRVRFAGEPPSHDPHGALHVRRRGREMEILVNGALETIVAQVEAQAPEAIEQEALSLEEIFMVSRLLRES